MSKKESVLSHTSNSESRHGLEPTWIDPQDSQSLVYALASLSETDRREILLALSPNIVTLLIEGFAAECSTHVEKMARLSPEIKRWAKTKGLL